MLCISMLYEANINTILFSPIYSIYLTMMYKWPHNYNIHGIHCTKYLHLQPTSSIDCIVWTLEASVKPISGSPNYYWLQNKVCGTHFHQDGSWIHVIKTQWYWWWMAGNSISILEKSLGIMTSAILINCLRLL